MPKLASTLFEIMNLFCTSKSRGTGRFLAILHLRTGDSTLAVVETNQFKHLSHISLVFRQGNDTVIKQFLAGRLAEYKVIDHNTLEYHVLCPDVHTQERSLLSTQIVCHGCGSLSQYSLTMFGLTVAGQVVNGDIHEKLRRTLHSLEKALRDVNNLSR